MGEREKKRGREKEREREREGERRRRGGGARGVAWNVAAGTATTIWPRTAPSHRCWPPPSSEKRHNRAETRRPDTGDVTMTSDRPGRRAAPVDGPACPSRQPKLSPDSGHLGSGRNQYDG